MLQPELARSSKAHCVARYATLAYPRIACQHVSVSECIFYVGFQLLVTAVMEGTCIPVPDTFHNPTAYCTVHFSTEKQLPASAFFGRTVTCDRTSIVIDPHTFLQPRSLSIFVVGRWSCWPTTEVCKQWRIRASRSRLCCPTALRSSKRRVRYNPSLRAAHCATL